MGEVNWLWVFTKYGQSMIKIQFRKKCYEMEFEKAKDLRSRFLIWKEMRMFAQHVFTSLKVYKWKGILKQKGEDGGV